ncbi:MAG: hypothetical protein LUO93_00380 [Methanomicrobiales archaeon]|nr:hypothetical protein [Methanomicrobiales archaeon]
MGCLVTVYESHKNDKNELLDSEQLKKLIYGSKDSARSLTVENLFHLHQMKRVDPPRSFR